VHWAKRFATDFVTAGARARSKRRSEPLTQPHRCEPLSGDIDCRPSLALRHPWLPDLLSPSLPAQGGEGGKGAMVNHGVGPLARLLTRTRFL
jgi:hypothetical protein